MKSKKTLTFLIGVPLYAAIGWGIWTSPSVVYYRAKRDLLVAVQSQMQIDEYQTPRVVDAMYWSGDKGKFAALLQHERDIIPQAYGFKRSKFYISLAADYVRGGDVPKAEEALGKAIATIPSLNKGAYPPTYIDIANTYIELNEASPAREALEKAFKLPKLREEDYTKIAEAYIKLKDADKAREVLSAALEALLTDITAHNRSKTNARLSNTYAAIAEAYLKLNAPDKAKEALSKISERVPMFGDYSHPSDYTAIARVYKKLGDSHKAVEALNKILEAYYKQQFEPDFYISIAEAYIELNALAKADEVLGKAIASIPTIDDFSRPEAYSKIADVYMELREPDKAKEVLNTALAMVPQNNIAYIAIVELYIKLKNFDKAKAVLNKTLEVAQEFSQEGAASLYVSIAEEYAKLGDIRTAYSVACRVQSKETRLSALSLVVKAWALHENPALAKKAEEEQAKEGEAH